MSEFPFLLFDVSQKASCMSNFNGKGHRHGKACGALSIYIFCLMTWNPHAFPV
jgi:hypothetical protein